MQCQPLTYTYRNIHIHTYMRAHTHMHVHMQEPVHKHKYLSISPSLGNTENAFNFFIMHNTKLVTFLNFKIRSINTRFPGKTLLWASSKSIQNKKTASLVSRKNVL